jgi:pilus assembly protein CpaB
MTRIRVFIVLAVALGLGGTFALATYRYIQNRPVREVSLPTTPVVVAAADLVLGTELSKEDLRVIAWPADAVPAGAFKDPQELVGRGLVQSVTLNEPFLPGNLSPVGAGAGLPPVIPEGKRAVSVRVNDVIGVAGYVLPGTHVDVLATVSPTNQDTDITSKVVLTNVLVLASGTKIEQNGENNKPISVSVVTLQVDPMEAERLTLASTEGKIQLALRNPLDTTAPPTPGIRPAALLGYAAPRMPVARGAGAPPVAALPPPPPPTVEIIRGDKRAQEVVR